MFTTARKPRPKIEKSTQVDSARGPSFRILPLVIVAAVCLLGLRIQVVVSDYAARNPSMFVALERATAFAQSQPTPPAPTAAPAAEAPKTEAAAGGDAEKPAEGEDAESADASDPTVLKPSELTKSEIDTLQRLSERRQVIEQRERELQQKESLVKAAEQRLDQKIGQMQAVEKQLQALVQQYDAKKKAEIEQLVKIYTAMKPKDAARIFDDLDMNILVAVATTMKEAKVAPILAVMKADKARMLTEEMSTRRQLPGAGQEARAP